MVPLEEILEQACSATFASDCFLPSASSIKNTRYNAFRDDGNGGEITNHVHDRDDESGGCDVDGDDEGNGIVSCYCNDSVSSVKAYNEASDEDSGGGRVSPFWKDSGFTAPLYAGGDIAMSPTGEELVGHAAVSMMPDIASGDVNHT